ncbi:hypothetical protein CPB83DRAFT_140613 [Crepidotus variabilis]|uniref:Uncharacterized protein n=1 Tax=Crepidotus variabilis TaxID=179855 RepID=A0A9P6JIA1_9AGAR|nr:hypothetical protein CPB83DRAFT_140613 [Crepidotus variabilis]
MFPDTGPHPASVVFRAVDCYNGHSSFRSNARRQSRQDIPVTLVLSPAPTVSFDPNRRNRLAVNLLAFEQVYIKLEVFGEIEDVLVGEVAILRILDSTHNEGTRAMEDYQATVFQFEKCVLVLKTNKQTQRWRKMRFRRI